MITSKLKAICLTLTALNLAACGSATSTPTSTPTSAPTLTSTESNQLSAKQLLAEIAPACTASATPISQVQGQGAVSPMVDQTVTVRAVVSAVKPGMEGYYLLEEKSDWDQSAHSSEGVFVANTLDHYKVGDLMAVTAKVEENRGFTQLVGVTEQTYCGKSELPAPTKVTLPLTGKNHLEIHEGMLIELPQTLTLSDTYNLTRFGQVILSNGRMFQATNLVAPGAEANKLSAANQLNQLLLDDSSMAKNPPMTYAADHTFRTGNTISGIVGVVHYAFGNYLIEPLSEVKFTEVNARKTKPMVGKKGQLRVASFNVLNYFNGNGAEKTFPSGRGAHSKAEFARQDAKIVAAMKVIDADIFGLMEIENDGYGPHSAIAELAANLSKATGKRYDFVRPQSNKLGDDAIAVGMIYNTDTVQLQGQAATLAEPPFNGRSRQPLAQTFSQRDGGTFTLVVNHFKSKRCPKDKSSANADQGDGQGCWNLSRTIAATKLAKWLHQDPTQSYDPDVLIIGDLNANAQEQPVTTLIDAGYHNLVAKYQGKQAYSYVYRGLAGYLDHALASTSFLEQVNYATDWHINADEMRVSDYNLENKSAEQQKLFRADPFRSSDHDPMIIDVSPK